MEIVLKQTKQYVTLTIILTAFVAAKTTFLVRLESYEAASLTALSNCVLKEYERERWL